VGDDVLAAKRMRDIITVFLVVVMMLLTFRLTKLETIVSGLKNIVTEIHRDVGESK